MMTAVIYIFVGFVSIATVRAFAPVQIIKMNNGAMKLQAFTWQEEVDQFLNIDTACANRREIFGNLLSQTQVIASDVVNAIQENDIKKIAPPSLAYGKAVVGIQAVRRQLINDILPEVLTKGIPKLLEEGPKLFQEIINKGPDRGKGLLESVREISQDPSMVQTTVEDVRRELRNVVKSTPEGLETPIYDVIKDTESYQVRFYSPYSVCSTVVNGVEGSEMPDAVQSGNGFNELAEYVFGEKLAMTTPVICADSTMQFVLPKGIDSMTAPIPKSEKITIKDISSDFLAVREFPGFATSGEVSRQRAMLEDALLAEGVIYDNLSFKVFQYNPPYTLPWLRRNEVSLSVDMSSEDVSPPSPSYHSSPEAGE